MKKTIRNSELLMDFIPAMEELRQYKASVRIAHNTVKTIKNLYEVIKNHEKDRLVILNEHADKDKDNKPVIKDNQYVFSDDNIKKEAEQKMKDLMDKTTEIDIWPVSIEDFDAIKEVKVELFERLLRYGFVYEQEEVKMKKV